MSKDELLTQVNKDLREMHADLVGHRENPHLIKLTKTLIRLTNTPAQNEEMDKAEPPKPKCAHEAVNRKTGKCLACGEIPEDEE